MAFSRFQVATVSLLYRGAFLHNSFSCKYGLPGGFSVDSVERDRLGGGRCTKNHKISLPSCHNFSSIGIVTGQRQKMVAEPCGSINGGPGSFSWGTGNKLAALPSDGVTTRQGHLDKLSGMQKEQITIYIDELIDWNKRMNLTAITERPAIIERHIEDSLSLLPVIEQALESSNNFKSGREGAGAVRLVDVGTGAGLPGVILAIARPDWEVTLLDSSQKRCDFLRHVLKVARVEGPRVVWMRAEDAGRDPAMREAHDVAVARAVAEARVLAELCLPLVRVGGVFVAPKGPAPEDEVAAAESAVQALGAQLLGIHPVVSEGPRGARKAVVYIKVGETPTKYPRRAGMPSKRPL